MVNIMNSFQNIYFIQNTTMNQNNVYMARINQLYPSRCAKRFCYFITSGVRSFIYMRTMTQHYSAYRRILSNAESWYVIYHAEPCSRFIQNDLENVTEKRLECILECSRLFLRRINQYNYAKKNVYQCVLVYAGIYIDCIISISGQRVYAEKVRLRCLKFVEN